VIDKLPVLQTTGCTSFLWREVPCAACFSLFSFKDNAGNYMVFVDVCYVCGMRVFVVGRLGILSFLDAVSLKTVV
jgi:hypothetical protein